ncbi:MAG: type 4a pilus biogenesis protein PilO [Bdellovibrionota bacterium]|jgi:type IV pilus assembly protein PilO
MNAIFEKIEARPLSQKIALWCGTLLVLALVFWLYFYKGEWQRLESLNNKSETLSNGIATAQRKVRQLPRLRSNIEKLDAQLERVFAQLPDKKEIQVLLASLSSLATDIGLEVIKFTPQQEVIKDFFAEVPMYLEVEGNFHQLVTFFDEVGHLSRIVNIDTVSIDLNTESKEEVLVRSSCIITSFRYLDESERIAKAEADAIKAKSKRRRRR